MLLEFMDSFAQQLVSLPQPTYAQVRHDTLTQYFVRASTVHMQACCAMMARCVEPTAMLIQASAVTKLVFSFRIGLLCLFVC